MPKAATIFRFLRNAGLGLLLLLLVLVFYSPALRGGLLFDDDRYLTPPELQSTHGLWLIWSHQMGPHVHYFPVLFSTFWLEHRLWGETTLGYHLTDLLLHAGCAWLLVAIMRRLALPGAWLAAFIFALHPVCVESAAWISELKNTLSTLFYMSAGFMYLSFDSNRKRWRYLLALVFFILAVLTKSNTAVLPCALLVILWWRRGRLEWKRDVFPLLPWIAAGCAGGLVSAGIEGGTAPGWSLTFMQHLLLASRIVWFYAGKAVWPVHLMLHYPTWRLDASVWWQYLYPAGLLAVAVACWKLARKNRGPLATLLLYLITLFPMLGFVYIGWFPLSFVADHFLYLALLGLIAPAAVLLESARMKIPGRFRGLFYVPIAALLVALCSLTWREAFMFRDIETLYEQTVLRNPDSSMAHYNYGLVLLKLPGHLSEALSEIDESLRLKPDDWRLHDEAGYIFMTVKRGAYLGHAIEVFQRALQINPNDGDAEYMLGNALQRDPKRLEEAVIHGEAATRLKPDVAETHYALANVLMRLPGRLPDAISQCEVAARLAPESAEAHYFLGNALAADTNRLEEAVLHYQTALRLKPNYVEAEYGLGCALAKMPGRSTEAIPHLETALRLMPSLDPARELLEQLERQK